MNVSKDEAARALQEIGQADSQMKRLNSYADTAPLLILWGVIWLAANLVSEVDVSRSGLAWLIGAGIIGTPVTAVLVVRQAMRRSARMRQAGQDPKALGGRYALLGAAGWGWFIAMMTVVSPLNARQADALISLFFAFAYLVAGIWAGWRLIAIGAATAAAILVGYLFPQQHFYLWMGLVGGGALIIGGLWLRKA